MIEFQRGSPVLPDSFLAALFRKLAYVMLIEQQTRKSTKAAQQEVWRQIHQAQKGNPLTGEGVTKSGAED